MALIDDILKDMEGKEVNGAYLVNRYRKRFNSILETNRNINKALKNLINQGKIIQTPKRTFILYNDTTNHKNTKGHKLF